MLFRRKHISEYPVYYSLGPGQRSAIAFCERTLNKRCTKNYVKFLNKNLKKVKKKNGWHDVNARETFFTDPLKNFKGWREINI